MEVIENQNIEPGTMGVGFLDGQKMPDLFRQFFLTAPAPQAVVGPGGALLMNQACRQLLHDTLGSSPRAWQRYLAGALTRLDATGRRTDVVRSTREGMPDLTLSVGPEVHESGLRVLSLQPATAGEGPQESLAETVSTLYHELRTPLASMKSSLQLVIGKETGPLNGDQERFLNMMSRNVDRLNRLVDDLLDTSRAAVGGLELDTEAADIMPLVRETVQMHQEQAIGGGLLLEAVRGPAELVVGVDRDKLVQMLTNVLGNALKFTPAGGRVGVTVQPAGPERNFVIEVADTGPGMDEEACRRALEPFRRVHDQKARPVPGTGLGLHITRGLARAHGGDLMLESTPGEGTRARILLPYEVEKPDPVFSG